MTPLATSTAARFLNKEAVSRAFLAILIISVIPNIIFLAISPWLMVPRLFTSLIYVLAAILAFFLPPAFAYLLFGIVAALDAFIIISLIFDMPFETSLAALKYLTKIDIAASQIYIAGCIFGISIPIIMAFLFNKNRSKLREASLLPTMLVSFIFCAIGFLTNSYKPMVEPAIFDSAMKQNGLTSEALLARDRNFLIVLVEGMGAYADPQQRALLQDRLAAASAGRFELKHGHSPYFGSTTGATSRELCGRWATFAYYLKAGQQNCLPNQLARAGYETINYHAGYSELFSRKEWYPKIGIQTLNFREDIEASHPHLASKLCGSVTLGLCDDDMGELVRQTLVENPDQRKFVYWLTLNSHVPYVPRKDGILNCGTEKAAIQETSACHLTDIWIGVFDSLARIAADPDMPPVDILIVGDHHTPMWSRKASNIFVKDYVDWYYLSDLRPSRPKAL